MPGTWMMSRPALHFIGFRGNEYVSARRVWGPPDFFHVGWISASNSRARLATPSFLPRMTGTGCQRGTLIRTLSRQTLSAMETRDSLTYPPRGLNREEAARYVGIGTSLFDRLVEEGRMPKPKHIG